MNPKEQPGRRSLAALRLFLFAWMAMIPLASLATSPSWWTTYGVLSGGVANDYSAANQGQARNIAFQAISELDNDLWQFGGAGSQLENLAVTLSATTAQTQDYAAICLGQMKALSQPFFDSLLALGYNGPPLTTGTYPWTTSGLTANDYAMCNIGQIKFLFSFDVLASTPSIGNGVPDWYAEKYFPSIISSGSAINPGAFVAWSGSQVTILQAYQQGLNPIDFYNGQTPILTIVSGTNQTGSPGGFVPAPLVVAVTDSNANPLIDAPVIFTVTTGTGLVQLSSTAFPATSVTAITDGNGNAQTYFQLPAVLSGTSQITTTTGAASTDATGTFTEYADNGTGTFASPFAPSNVIGSMNSDGSETITWQNNDTSSPIYIYALVSGTWEVTGTLAAGTTTYTTVGSLTNPLEIGNNFSPGGSTGTTGTGQPANNTVCPIPAQSYAAIDMSGSITSTAVTMIALDDSNNVAFECTGSSSSAIYTWTNGTASLAQNLSIGYSATTIVDGTTTYGEIGVYSYLLTPNGNFYVYSLTTDGSFSGYIKIVNGNVTQVPLPNGFDARSPDDLSWLYAANNNGYCGYIDGDISGVYYSPGILVCSGSTALFDSILAEDGPSLPGIPVVDDIWEGTITKMTTNGWACGGFQTVDDYNYYGFLWTGNQIETLPDESWWDPSGLNDVGQVINGGSIWTSAYSSSTFASVTPGQVQTISQLIPAQYYGQLSSINSIAISGTNANGSVGVLFSSQYQPPANAPSTSGTFLLTLASGTNTLQQVSLPSNVSNLQFGGFNANGLIAGIGNITTGTGSAAVTGTSHALLLVPEDVIQVDTFIPQTWVQGPISPYHPFTTYIYNGNSRKNPLDASLTSGSSLFTQNSPEFKARQTMDVCAFPNYDPDGSQEQATKKTSVGETREYNASVLVNGEIPASAATVATGTATPYVDNAYVYHPSAKSVVADMGMDVSDPLAFGSSLAPAQYYIFVTIDRSDPSNPTYSIEGTSCEFPAYEIYINGQLVYSYDPIPGGHGPYSLLLGPVNTIETSGTLSH